MQSPAAETRLIAALRRATASRHRDIETLLSLDDGALDLPRYRRVLVGFAVFLRAWEPAVAASLPDPWRAWFAPRTRLPLLERDLQVLDVRSDEASRAASAGMRLSWQGIEEVFGSLYVIEGSALGGQVLARGPAARLGLGAGNGAAYFHGFGDATGAMWRDFRECLDRAVGPSEAMHSRACASAMATFDAMTAVFRRVLHVPAAAAA